MKYRVHAYVEIRVSYEVEAESPQEARDTVDAQGWNMTPVDTGKVEDGVWSGDFVVDPLHSDGSVDYENVTNFSRGEAA